MLHVLYFDLADENFSQEDQLHCPYSYQIVIVSSASEVSSKTLKPKRLKDRHIILFMIKKKEVD